MVTTIGALEKQVIRLRLCGGGSAALVRDWDSSYLGLKEHPQVCRAPLLT